MTTGPSPVPAGAAPGDPAGQAEVQSNELSRVGAVVWIVLSALLALDVLRRGHGRSAAVSVVVLGLLCAGVYALAWRPGLVIDERAVTLVNPLRTAWIPWGAVTSVGGRWSLEVRTSAGTYTAWASGPRPRRRRPRGLRARLPDAAAVPEMPDESRVSRRVIARWEDFATRVPDGSPAEQIRVTWDRPLVAVVAVLLLALGLLLVGA